MQADDVRALLALNGSYPPCRTEAYGNVHNNSVPTTDAYTFPDASVLVAGFKLPLHVNLTGLSDVGAMHHLLSFYDGESLLIESKVVANTPKVAFSRAGGIYAGVLVDT